MPGSRKSKTRRSPSPHAHSAAPQTQTHPTVRTVDGAGNVVQSQVHYPALSSVSSGSSSSSSDRASKRRKKDGAAALTESTMEKTEKKSKKKEKKSKKSKKSKKEKPDAAEVNTSAGTKRRSGSGLAGTSPVPDTGTGSTGSRSSSTARAATHSVRGQSALPPHARVLAPMVGGSELAFRLLCRRYGADLCYTPMMYSEKYVADEGYRTAQFHTCAEDRPLVAHFCGNDPETLLAAGRLIQSQCDAIDLNLGCPQRIAHSGHFGSYLLDLADRPLVLRIVQTLATGLDIPVFCKIRLLETVAETVELCRQLAGAGCRLIAVHARYRGTATRRRDGPAHLDELAEVLSRLGTTFPCPILANGNVKSAADVTDNIARTGADGVMSAEGLLDNPTLFDSLAPATAPSTTATTQHATAMDEAGAAIGNGADDKAAKKLGKKLREVDRLASLDRELTPDEAAKVSKRGSLKKKLKRLGRADGATSTSRSKGETGGGGAPPRAAGSNADDKVALAVEYLDLCDEHPSATLSSQVFHVRRMCKKELDMYQLLTECSTAQSATALRDILKRCAAYIDGTTPFVYDPARDADAKEVADRRKAEVGKRKAYDSRMARKAKREGLAPDHYVKLGRDPPTQADLAAIKLLGEPDRIPAWRAQFGQHCFGFHCAEGGCARDRACAFLHTDISREDPTWLQESTV